MQSRTLFCYNGYVFSLSYGVILFSLQVYICNNGVNITDFEFYSINMQIKCIQIMHFIINWDEFGCSKVFFRFFRSDGRLVIGFLFDDIHQLANVVKF